MKKILKNKIERLVTGPGAYIFKDKTENILYIGKAKNIKKRVKAHFQKRSGLFLDFTPLIDDFDYIETDSEQDAFILEDQLIKKFQPKFNVRFKDDKSYLYVVIKKNKWWRVYTTHQPKHELGERSLIGPFISSYETKLFLSKIRKILPYCSCQHQKKDSCLYADLALCPSPFSLAFDQDRYAQVLKTLSVLLRLYRFGEKLRIETYDISHIAGTLTVGSMVVYQNNKIEKSQYRLFKIKTVTGQNDVACLEEIIKRRFQHPEWPNPDLVILDGGKAQLKAAKLINCPVLAISKISKSTGRLHSLFSSSSISLSVLPAMLRYVFLQLRDEAHRFAITYHKKRRLQANNLA